MRITRKYNLEVITRKYESIEIEAQGEDPNDIIAKIDAAWRAYCKAIVDGKVR